MERRQSGISVIQFYLDVAACLNMPEVPALSSKEMAELDRRLVDDFRIDLSMMMENAGRSVATQARTIMGGVEGNKILVMAGKGNNGGGGMAAARNLHNWGAHVNVVLATPAHELKELPLRQFEILRRIGLQSGPPFSGRNRTSR